MDINTLLHIAQKNTENQNDGRKYYSTKCTPAKKETKEKKLSENIQKFIKKQQEEEQRKQREKKEKLAKLLASRDQKSKNKISKMLKLTKSANKSILDNAEIGIDCTASLDQDDYGYVSNEANAFYKKYIDKVKDVSIDNPYLKNRPSNSAQDLSNTKDRIKSAMARDQEESKSRGRQRNAAAAESSKSSSSASKTSSTLASATTKSSNKMPLYEPAVEEASRKREEQEKRSKNARPMPTPMDFQALLKLAEQKQHEPILINQSEKTKKPERLLSAKEKQEWEERMRAKETHARREREFEQRSRDTDKSNSTKTSNRALLNGRIPKLSTASKESPTSSCFVKPNPAKTDISKGAQPTRQVLKPTFHSILSSSTSSSNNIAKHTNSKLAAALNAKYTKPLKGNNDSSRNSNKSEGETRHISALNKGRLPADVHRSANNTSARQGKLPTEQKKLSYYEEEYDSELDDFIEDGEEDDQAEYSSHIRELFGYDRRKYHDDDDDANMESSFAQVQREEYISKRLGIQEDLEDMKMEEIAKKRKQQMFKKKRL